MSPVHGSTPERQNALPNAIEARLQLVLEDFLAALQAGEQPDRAEVVAEQPELAPWLDERLKLVELVFHAAQDGDAKDHRHVPGDRAKRLKCPHCGNQVQLVEPRPKEVTCVNCGSSFRIEPDTTATYHSRRPAGEFGRFQVIELLGRGAFGEVYKAHDRELDRFVALKVPRADYFASSEEAQRFLREARSAAGLRHPSIVQVHEIAHERETPYIVSDYIEGLTLADLISGGRPGFRESAELIAQLADAVDYAHRQKVVHRDIKPSNILLTAPEGKNAGGAQFVPFLTDFGLARRDEGEITVTLDGQVLGTPAYMSPEQAAGDHARVDGRSDVYSLGVVLYELLSGELPFRGSRRMLLHQVLHDEPRPPRTLNDRIPRDLETICLKAMAKERARRYATAVDFRDDLRRFLRGDPITARRVSRTERAWRWCRRNPVIAGLSSMAVLLLVAIALVSTLAYLRESKLVGEKDSLIRDKDGLITEKEGLIREKSQLVTKERAASAQAVKNETLATERAEKLERQSDELASQLYIARIAKATNELDRNDYRAAEEILTSIPLKRRGWEYYQLWHRLEGTPLTLRGHSWDVKSVSFSPDGARLASASTDGVKLWDVLTGVELRIIPSRSTGVAFSPDGTRLATASWDGPVKMWDAQSGVELQTLHGHMKEVTSVCFSPDGTGLASTSHDGTVKLCDPKTGAELQEFRGHSGAIKGVNSISFSPDGTRLASGSWDQTIKLWNTQSGAELQTLRGHTTSVASISFSPDGTRLASASFEAVKLWDAQTGAEMQTLRGHPSGATSVSFSPDGWRLASGTNDGTVTLWDAQTGAELKTLRGHSGAVNSLSFSLDGLRLASASWDGTIKLWSTQPDAGPHTFVGTTVESVSFSADGTKLALACVDGILKLCDVQTGAELQSLRGSPFGSVTVSPDGTRLASGTKDGKVKLWDAQTGAELLALRGHLVQAHSVIFSPDGARLASASSLGVKLWETQTGAELHTFPVFHIPRLGGGRRDAVSFSPGGTRLAGASWDGTIKLWDIQSGAELQTFPGHELFINSISFSPDGTTLASGSDDKTVKLWNTQSGTELQTLRGHTGMVYSVRFSSDGTRLASASWDGTIKLWDAKSGAELQTLHGHTGGINSINFSPDGRRLASAGGDQTIKLWDTQSEGELQALRGHTGGIKSISFSADGTRLVSRDGEDKTLVWKLPKGELLPDEPVPNAADLTDQSPDPLLRAIPRDREIILIRKNPKYDPWKEDAERRQKLLPKWHANDAAKAEEAENWYAAAFHLAWLMKSNPDDLYLPRRHSRVVKHLTAKGMPVPVICRGIPEVAIPQPTVTTMNLTYITRGGEMICYRFSDRSREPVRSPTGTPRWIGWNSGEGRWIALVDKQLQRLPVNETSPPETFWTFEEAPESVAVTPDGRRLAWLRNSAGRHHLMVQRYDDEPPQDLGFGYDPDWSADGQRLTWVTSADRWYIGVWDGKATTFTTPPFNSISDSISVFPAFAPDGKHIVFGSSRRDKTRQIAVIAVDGEQIRLITKNGQLNSMPAYSPDGRYLAYVRSGPEGDELAFIDLLTEEETVIANDAAPVRPVWRNIADSP